MILQELRLLAFGAFTDRVLDFSANPLGLHVVYGDNEAGKSTALRAISGLLYGIPARTTDNFRHDYQRMRIGGLLRRADGATLEIIRRKGNANTLLDTQGNPLEERELTNFLGGVTPEQFSALFGIDYGSLRNGAESLLKEGGEVGQSLFSASLGGAAVQGLLASLNAEADGLFRPRGRDQIINAAIRGYDEAMKRVNQASLSSRAWEEQHRRVTRLLGERDAIAEAYARQTRERTRLQRIKSVLPGLARRREVLGRLLAMGEVRELPESFAETRHAVLGSLQQAKEAAARATLAIQQLEEKLAELTIPAPLLAEGERIAELFQRVGSYRKARQDRGGLVGKLEQAELEAGRLLPELPGLPSLAAARALRVPRPQRARLRELGEVGQRLQSDREQLTKTQQKQVREQERVTRELAEAPPAVDCRGLVEAITRIRQRGALEEALRKEETALAHLQADAERELQRLAGWSGTLAEAEALPVPTTETVERFAGEWQQWAHAGTQWADRRDEVTQQLDEVRMQLEALRQAGEVPTEEDLRTARERREAGWRLVKRDWLAAENVSAEAAAYAEGPLAEAYEQAVAEADTTADRLRRESERVTRQANYQAQQQRLTEHLARITAEQDALAEAVQTWQAAWAAAWRPAGITPLTPVEMRGWLNRHQEVLRKAALACQRRQDVEELARQTAEARALISERLAGIEEPAAADGETLAALLERAQAVADRHTGNAQRRAELTAAQARLQADMRDIEDDARRLDDARTRWQAEWTTAVTPLGLPATATPAEVTEVLQSLDALHKHLDEAESFRQRIEGIDRDAEAFSTEVASLRARLGLSEDGRPIEMMVQELHAQVAQARLNANTREGWLAAREGYREELRQAGETITTMTGRLEELCRQAQCPTPEGLEEAIARSREYLALRASIETLEADLLQQGDGHTLAELEAESAEVDADVLPARLEELDRQLADTVEQRDSVLRQLGEAQMSLQAMDGGPAAAEAAAEAQGMLAKLREPVEHYLRLRLAARLLSEEIERYRAANQHPVLARAGELFTTLTLGAFTGIRTDYDHDDRLVLVGVRDTQEEVWVPGMSDGTRDQLYLALRLATLEQTLRHAEPLPFVVDDILITFDDRRAAAALEALASFARHTQTILFTHHARLAELAQCCCGGVVTVHDLGAVPVPA